MREYTPYIPEGGCAGKYFGIKNMHIAQKTLEEFRENIKNDKVHVD